VEERNKPSGSVPYPNGHVQSLRNYPHTIKSDAIYPMDVFFVDVDALARVVPATRIRTSLLHILHSKRRVLEATIIIIVRGRLCRMRMVDV